MFMSPGTGGNGKGDGDDMQHQQQGTPKYQKTVGKKKEESDDTTNSNSSLPGTQDFEKNKRRNSFTDSPLTELSASSVVSNGDSADDGSEGAENGKQEEAVSTNSSTSISGMYSINSSSKEKTSIDFPINFGLNETETIDAMEMENVHEILVTTSKQLMKKLKYNKWTDALCQTIITGDFIGFNRRFKMIIQCLKKRQPHRYKEMSNQEMASFVAQTIVDRFYNSDEETSILMLLLTNHNSQSTCADRGHGYCRTAHMLLKLLERQELLKLMEMTANRTGKTALHLAVATGHPCQLQVLLALADVDPNKVDKSGRAAIHYAVERNNLEMVKMLMWYGADISMVQSENSKFNTLYISLCANPNATVDQWLQERLKAISRKMLLMARELGSKHLAVQKELSTTHFIRLDEVSMYKKEGQLNLHTKPNLLKSSHNKNRAVLFAIPIVFRSTDQFSAASDPKIARVLFPYDVVIAGQPILDPLKDGQQQAFKLSPLVFKRYHNETFYAYNLPSSIDVGLHRLSCRLGPTFQPMKRDNIIIAVQAFLCNDMDTGKSKTD